MTNDTESGGESANFLPAFVLRGQQPILQECPVASPASSARGFPAVRSSMPFAETNELVAGLWPWEVKDMNEAVARVKRCPNPRPEPSEIEIRSCAD